MTLLAVVILEPAATPSTVLAIPEVIFVAGKTVQGRVGGPRFIAIKRVNTNGYVLVSGGIAIKRATTDSRVVITSSIVTERTSTDGRVIVAGGIVG